MKESSRFLNFADSVAIAAIVIALAVWVFFAASFAPRYWYGRDAAWFALPLYRSAPSSHVSLGDRHIVAFAVTGLVVFLCCSQLIGQRKDEKAAALEGDIQPISVSNPKPGVSVQIGPHAGILQWPFELPRNQFQFAYDAGLRVTKGPDGIEVSTPVRDRSGNLVAEIVANHWRVYPPYCSDKNYDDNRSEIKDSAGHVVLQLTLFEDKIILQGEWRTPFGTGQRLIEAPEGGSYISFWKNPEGEQQRQELITPMFRYPSSEHWAELVTKAQP